MRNLLFILTVFLPTILFGQTISLNIKEIGDSLQTVGIDTFIIYKNYFPGSINSFSLDRNASETERHEKWCKKADAAYILFNKNGQTFIQKRSECYFYTTVTLDSCNAFALFITDFDTIVSEKILTNSYVNKNGDTIEVSINHSDMTDLYLCLGVNKKIFTTDWFDLSPTNNLGEDTNGYKNINYVHNSKTKTRGLILSIEDKISKQIFTKE